MSIYIAGPFFNEKQICFIEDIENLFKVNRMPFYSPRSEGVLLDLDEEARQKAKKAIYDTNVTRIKNCSIMVAVIDDRDTGTIWEMGYAAALGKPIISISNESYGLNVMLAESVQAHVKNLEDLYIAIVDPEFKGELLGGVF